MIRGIAAMTVATAALVSGCAVSPPPKDFAIKDAVLALRVQEGDEDSSYLVLVSPEGKTRAIELEGIETAGISWTEHGITTSDPTHDYTIGKTGLTASKRTSEGAALETDHEWYRVQVGKGTLVGFSPEDSAKDPFVTYIDGENGKATTRVAPYSDTSTAAVCGDRVYSSGRGTGTKAFEEDSQSVPESQWDRAALTSVYPHDGRDILSALERSAFPGTTSPCVDGIVYEPWQDDESGQHLVRTWNTAKGAPAGETAVDHEIVYPSDDSLQIGGPSAMTVSEGQLVWVVENTVWRASLPTTAADPIEAREVGHVDGSIGLDAEVLTYSANAAYSVAADSDLHERGRGKSSRRVWRELTELNLVRTDLASGESSIALEIEMKDVDFPTKDVYVTALELNPEWLAKRGE